MDQTKRFGLVSVIVVLLTLCPMPLICAQNAEVCAPKPSDWDQDDDRYHKKANAAEKAFAQGKYSKALDLTLQSLASRDEKGFPDVYLSLGLTYSKLGNFDKAFQCYIEATTNASPRHRTLIAGFGDEKVRRAAQSLFDHIQFAEERSSGGSCYLDSALAELLRHVGRIADADVASETNRVQCEASAAWDEAMKHTYSLERADRAAIVVYQRNNRPDLAVYARSRLGDDRLTDRDNGPAPDTSMLTAIANGMAMGLGRPPVPNNPQTTPDSSYLHDTGAGGLQQLRNNCLTRDPRPWNPHTKGIVAALYMKNTCSKSVTARFCFKGTTESCWKCDDISALPGESNTPASLPAGCTTTNCSDLQIMYNAIYSSDNSTAPTPNVDDSCVNAVH